jgi:transcription initiation factor TFIIIB Brf1 subunit/transcription initiation factor TFIIB
MSFGLVADCCENNDETVFNKEKTILSDLVDIEVSETIKSKAEDIFQQLRCTTKRGHRRKLLIFFCLLNAHRECGIHIDPKLLAIKVRINPSEATKASSMFSESQTGYRPKLMKVSALDIIPEYCQVLNFDTDTIEQVLELGREIIEKDSSLEDTKPQNVATGVLVYFCQINGVMFPKKELSKILNLSEVSINSITKRVNIIHNK